MIWLILGSIYGVGTLWMLWVVSRIGFTNASIPRLLLLLLLWPLVLPWLWLNDHVIWLR